MMGGRGLRARLKSEGNSSIILLREEKKRDCNG